MREPTLWHKMFIAPLITESGKSRGNSYCVPNNIRHCAISFTLPLLKSQYPAVVLSVGPVFRWDNWGLNRESNYIVLYTNISFAQFQSHEFSFSKDEIGSHDSRIENAVFEQRNITMNLKKNDFTSIILCLAINNCSWMSLLQNKVTATIITVQRDMLLRFQSTDFRFQSLLARMYEKSIHLIYSNI
jgi:hypothetical protein